MSHREDLELHRPRLSDGQVAAQWRGEEARNGTVRHVREREVA